jgi:polyphenol oxidase
MHSVTAADLRFYQFTTFDPATVAHGVFTRHGGVSPEPYASLNLSVSTGDAVDNVRRNAARAFSALDRDLASAASLWQVHSAEVVVAEQPHGAGGHLGQADALITDQPSVSLFLRFADCVPILLFDPRRPAVGVVHAGWRGTLKKILQRATAAMADAYGSRPADILAGIGPSVGPCHYAVGPELVERVRRVFGAEAEALLPEVDGRQHFDLWAANALTLREAGVQRIETAGMCTVCQSHDFFSHRATGGRTGRFGAVIALR